MSIVTLDAVQKLNKKRQQELRLNIQQNLFFLANNVLRASSQLELKECHAQMCSFLPQCAPISELPMENWSEIKERVLLSARGTLKSTILSAHLTQVILCNPNVRVMVIAGNVDKANQLVDLVRAHLQHPVIAHLFPEHQGLSKGNSFTTPARSITLRDDTIFSGSFKTINAGAHADYICLDDAATELAHRTPAGVQRTIDSMDDLAPVLENGGYLTFIGTRWAANDCPAIMFERAAELEKQTNERTLECLELPAWTVKEGHENNTPLTADDVDLLWPEKLTFTFLNRIFSKTPSLFRKQYLLEVDAVVAEEPVVQSITPEILAASVTNDIPFDEIPVMNGDLSAIKKTTSKTGSKTGQGDLCGIVGGFYRPENQTLVITELINRRFEDPDVFLRQLWEMHCKFRILNRVMFRVEDVQNASSLWSTPFRELNMFADFQLPSNTSGVFGARDTRVMALQDGIRQGKIKFDSRLLKNPYWRDVLYQFCLYPNLEHDDLIDSAAQLWEYCKTLTANNRVSEVLLSTRKEQALAGSPDGFDSGIPIATPLNTPITRRGYSDTVRIRRPDVQKPRESDVDPFYARSLSVNKYADTPL